MHHLANAQYWDWPAGGNTGRLFLAFGGPVCADRISNCPLEKVLTYKNLIYLLNLQFLCQLTDIMSSLCGVGVRVRVRVNNFSSKTTRPRDVLFFLKDTLSIEDEKLFKACKSVCSSVC